jgi:hypothetical protein
MTTVAVWTVAFVLWGFVILSPVIIALAQVTP